MKEFEFEIALRIRVEADTMETAEECAESIIGDLIKDGEQFFDRPIEAAEWDKITPIRKCRPKEGK